MRAKVSGLLIALVSGAASAESPAWIETAYYAFESAKAIGASSAGSHALVQKAYGMPDVPPVLSSTAIWSPIPRSKEIGREEAIFGRADHRVSA